MKIAFTSGYDISDDDTTIEKGHRSDIIFIDDNENYYEFNFVTIARLKSDLNYNLSVNKPYFTDVGMVILELVTKHTIMEAMKSLANSNFVKRLKPLENIQSNENWTLFEL